MEEIQINGTAVPVDFMDVDFIDIYEKETHSLEAELKKERAKKYSSLADQLRAQCALVEKYLDTLLGEGISAKIFKGKNNFREHLMAIVELANGFKASQQELNNITNQYTQRIHQNGSQMAAMHTKR